MTRAQQLRNNTIAKKNENQPKKCVHKGMWKKYDSECVVHKNESDVAAFKGK